LHLHNFITARTEILNKCNRQCDFCPSSTKRFLARPRRVMTQELFEIVVQRFSDMKYTGSWGPYHTGEPLLVKNLEDYLEYYHKHVPLSIMILNSNGMLLTADKLVNLFRIGVGHFMINVYDDDDMPRIQGIVKETQKDLDALDVEQLDRRPNVSDQSRSQKILDIRARPMGKTMMGVKWQNRGGNVDYLDKYGLGHKRKVLPRPSSCARAFRDCYIDVDGNIRLCCSDWFTDVATGNVQDGDLMAVFNSPERLAIMRMLHKKDRHIPLCCRCDYGGGGYQGSLRVPDVARTIWGNADDVSIKGYLWNRYGGNFHDMLSVDTKMNRAHGWGIPPAVPKRTDRYPR
jgi:MoaA/NifB/PqqE/SkfB family radical SAM enzyme